MYEVFGTYGAWLNPVHGDARISYAPELEELGYRTIWVGIGPAPVGDLRLVEDLLRATKHAVITTAVINMWQDTAASIAKGYHRLADEFGSRVKLGVGLGHPESRDSYEKPYQRMVDYVDDLGNAGVPSDAVLIAALGPRTLRLAARSTLGAHPYLTTPVHTRFAREAMGADAFLAPEHKVVLTEDPAAARRIGRPMVQNPYLGLRNYTNNLLRQGFTEADVVDGGSDRLIEALVVHGDPETIIDHLAQHLAAGANHVGIQVLTHPGNSPMPAYRALAPAATQTTGATR